MESVKFGVEELDGLLQGPGLAEYLTLDQLSSTPF
jgi:hypothetical protein